MGASTRENGTADAGLAGDALNLPGPIILQGILGSQAYGMNHAASDEDRKGVYVASTVALAGLNPPKDTVVRTNPDFEYHEVGKFIRLALKCNPTVLEQLFVPVDYYEHLDVWGNLLVEHRSIFLSKRRVAGAFGGYSLDQVRRMLRATEAVQEMPGDPSREQLLEELKMVGRSGEGVPVVPLLAEKGEAAGEPQAAALSGGEGLQRSQASPPDVRHDQGRLSEDAGRAEGPVPDLPVGDAGGIGPLPLDREGEGVSLPQVQSGPGPLPGRSGFTKRGSQLHRREKLIRHTFRLMEQGLQLLETGELVVRVADPQRLFEVGQMTNAEVVRTFMAENKRFAHAYENSVLPEHGDHDKAAQVLAIIRANNL